PWLRPALVRLKQAADLQASTLGQALVATLVTDSAWFAPHLDALRATYAPRGRALAGALAKELGERLQVNRPTGGMFLWGRFTDGTVAADLLPRALAHGVGFVPGAEFFTADPDPCAIRLSFATNPPDALAEAASRLASAHADVQVDA
ncbi:MAG TPA: aminotransferase class I/II-fold pyridoxal phosphate-dependent enzyme, partial [Acidimicrobiales bacterium]